MTVYVFPAGRVVSSDGTVLSPATNVGDILYLTSTGSLSIRAQNGAGAPVEVAIPSIGGGSGTANRIVKFTATGVMDDANATDTGSTFVIGNAGQWQLQCGYGTGGGWQFFDPANNTLCEVSATGKLTVQSDIVQNTGATIITPLGGLTAAVIQASAGGQLARAADATALPYTPANPLLWVGPAPTNVEDAIERIAAAVSGLLVGPIP